MAFTGYVELGAGLVAATALAVPMAADLWINGAAIASRVSTSPSQVIFDTNAVFRYRDASALVAEDEAAVTTRVVQAELRAVGSREGLGVPRVAANMTTIDDVLDVDLRINLRGLLNPGPGRFGDGAIGATAIRTGSTLLTADVNLAEAVAQFGGSVRLLR